MNTANQLGFLNSSVADRDKPAGVAEMVDLALQVLGQFHRRAIFPELGVGALVGAEMEDDEVADVLPFAGG